MTAPCLSPSCERLLLPGQGITVGTDRFCDLECWSQWDPDEVETAREQWAEGGPVAEYLYPKSVREALCAAQSALACRAHAGMDVDRVRRWIDHLQALIDQVDDHRPLGPDGKHRDRHTPTCGCDGHTGAWGIAFPADPTTLESS